MTTVYKPIEFAVDCLIAQGLYILAGAPKIGKSWLSLDICLSVAKGQPVLGQSTKRGTALYLCLEGNFTRIQNRLYQITDEPTDELYFAVIAESIGNGLEEQIECFKKQHENLRLVFIDTLQMVRSSEEIGYVSDYKELTSLKIWRTVCRLLLRRETLMKGLPSIPRREDTLMSGARIDFISVSLVHPHPQEQR